MIAQFFAILYHVGQVGTPREWKKNIVERLSTLHLALNLISLMEIIGLKV